ncbi:beta strand repeat-containing protein [Stieleria neptunia]|uniref:beta strand repeat-containing protein n=1 Tax=Stieleria neptunia TaxID=2527979 RepID=UPI0011A56DB3|nr:hypothetical protein [Stieleria neptunia]
MHESLENRNLLAASIFLANNGFLRVIGDSTAADQIAVSFNAAENQYTISNDAPISVVAFNGASDVDGNSGDNSATLDVDDFTVAMNRLRFELRGGNDSVEVNGFSLNGEGIQVVDGAGTDSVDINAPIGTGANPAAFAIIDAESLETGSDIFTGVLGINISAPTTLSGDTGLNSTGTISLNDTVDGGWDVSVDGTQVTVSADIGGTTPVAGFTANATSTQVAIGSLGTPVMVNATGNVSLTGVTNANVSGDLTAGGNLSLASASNRLTSAGSIVLASGGTIDLDGPVAGNGGTPNLRLTTPTGAIDANDAISNIAALEINDGAMGVGADTVTLGGAITAESIDIRATTQVNSDTVESSVGGIAIHSPQINLNQGGPGAVRVAGPTTIVLDGSVDASGRDLNIEEGTSLDVSGIITAAQLQIASTAPFATVSLQGGANTTGFSITGTAISVGGDISSSVDNGSFQGPVTVVNDVAISSADILFLDSDINSDAGNRTLELSAENQLSMLGGAEVGTGTPFGNVNLGAGGDLTLNAVTAQDTATIRGGRISATDTIMADIVELLPFVPTEDLEVYNQSSAPGTAVNAIDLSILGTVAPASELRIGNGDTGTVTFFNDNSTQTTLDLSSIPLTTATADNISVQEKINAGANDLTMRAGATLAWTGLGSVTAAGTLTIEQTDISGNLVVNGPMRDIGDAVVWSPGLDVVVDGNGGNVEFTSEVGGDTLGSLTVSDTNLLSLNHPTSASFTNGIDITAVGVNVNGGLVSRLGDVTIDGDLNQTGPTELVAGNGQSVEIDGNVNGGGERVRVRSFVRTAGLDTVTLGNITNASDVLLSQSPATTANLGGADVTGGISVRAATINTQGVFTAQDGNLHFLGNLVLAGNTALNHESATNNVFIVQGTIDGAFDLDVDSLNAQFSMTGEVGGTTALANLIIETTNAGANTFQPITVVGNFEWTAGGRIIIRADITAGTMIDITSTGGTVQLRNGATLNAPIVNVTP